MKFIATLSDEVSLLWGNGRGKFLALIAAPWGILVGARMAYPVLLPEIQDSFNLSLTTGGLLITFLWLGGSLGQFPSGILSDRYRERRIMAISVAVVAIALGIIIVSPNVFVLFFATLVWGLAHSLYPIARITVLTDLYPERIGSALGVTMATGDLGQTILPPIIGIVGGILIWQMGLGILLPVLVVASVLIWMHLPDGSPPDSAVDSLSRENLRYVFDIISQPAILFMAVILFLYGLMWQAFTAFYPTYLINIKELSPTIAAGLFGAFFGIGVIVKPVFGMLYDRIGVRWALIFALIGPVAGLVMLPAVSSLVALMLATILVSTMLGTGAITQSYLADIFPRDMRGTGLGATRSIVFSLAAFGPVLFGGVADRGYFDEGYILLAGLIVVVIILTLNMPRS